MTRPMPGPPEHDPRSWPHVGAPTSCDLCADLCWPADNHLTHVECAAHFWQAQSALGAIEAVLVSPALIKSRIRTWRRFMDTTHALEVE